MIDCKFFNQTIPVPGGTFAMGSDSAEIDGTEREWISRLMEKKYQDVFRCWLLKEYPAHPVKIRAFSMMKYPVTNRAYKMFLSRNSTAEKPESVVAGYPDDHPVWGVSLPCVGGFIEWLSAGSEVRWRLPTEPEWEWAARGGTDTRYPFGNTFDATRCNTVESGRRTTTPVDAFPLGQSPFGIYDLAGNVEEWTATTYAPYPGGHIVEDDLWESLGPAYPILRGGSFALGGDLARTRRRHGPHPRRGLRVSGFRLVREL